MKSIPINPNNFDFDILNFKSIPAVEIVVRQKVVPGEKLLVSFSGGGDSTAILLILKSLSQQLSFSINAYYFQHAIRSLPECAKEQHFVTQICSYCGIPLFIESAESGEIVKVAEEQGRSVEEVARFYRRKSLFSLMEKEGFNRLVTGHHADDQLETLMMRFFQGSGHHGLCGLVQSDTTSLRPLLQVSRLQITNWLKANSIPYLTDTSNSDPRYLRNRIRHELKPVVESLFPGCETALLSLTAKMKSLSLLTDTLAKKAPEWQHDAYGAVSLDSGEFLLQSSVLQSELLFSLLNSRFSDYFETDERIPYRLLQQLISSVKNSSTEAQLLVWKNIIFYLHQGRFFIEAPVFADTLHSFEKQNLILPLTLPFGRHLIHISLVDKPDKLSKGVWIPFSSVTRNLEIRSAQPQDCIQQNGISIPLKKVLSSLKIARHRRCEVPLIIVDGAVVAVLGSVFGGRDRIANSFQSLFNQTENKWIVIIA